MFGGSGAWLIVCWGNKLGLSDIPNERSSHIKPTPKGGGIGILAAFLFSSLYTGISCLFWIPVVGVSILGLFSDKYEIVPQVRLFLQFIAAIVIVTGIKPLNSNLNSIALIIFFTIYLVGTANYYNFMDGINGIAAITGIVGFGLLSYYIFVSKTEPFFMILCICISLSCLGFLPFNIFKGKVFMGDVGSILLGFVFACIVIFFSRNLLDFICLSSFLFPFYADEITTMVVRIKDGENLSKPHRRHIYQILANEFSIPQWKVSVGYGFAQLLIGLSVLFIKDIGMFAIIFTLAIYFCCFIWMSYIFHKKLLKQNN